ncbi:MAG TPA: hypothetical protein VKH19_07440 [Gemmatimonadaceae bacterium]|nr:hypothetical protein [Gemmatimonadaceae bacterium]
MSDNEPADLHAFHELELLVRNLGEELSTFRRRALAAESQLKDAGHDVPASGVAEGGGRGDLAVENRELRRRVEHAEERVRQLMDRVRFLRQQIQLTTGVPAGRS